MLEIRRLVDGTLFIMDEDEIRKNCVDGTIGVYYTDMSSRKDLSYYNELKKAVLEDSPEISDDCMYVERILIVEDCCELDYLSCGALYVKLPIDVYFKILRKGKIKVKEVELLKKRVMINTINDTVSL